MRKTIYLLFFIKIFFISFIVFSDFTICDSGNINFSGNNISEICNGGYELNDLEKINSFTGNIINYNIGYLGTNIDSYNINSFEDYSIIGFFDNYKKTIINNKNPNFNYDSGYIGMLNSKIDKINLNGNYPEGFFNLNKKTIIGKTNLIYNLPVGFIKNDYSHNKKGNNIPRGKGSGSGNSSIRAYTYQSYFDKVLKVNSNIEYLKSKIAYYEYDKFINNVLNLYINSNINKDKIISVETQNKINYFIQENNNFKNNLGNLTNKLREINNGFNYIENEKGKKYIIKNILKE